MTFGAYEGAGDNLFDAISHDEEAIAEVSTAGGEGTNSSKLLTKGQGSIASKQHSKSQSHYIVPSSDHPSAGQQKPFFGTSQPAAFPVNPNLEAPQNQAQALIQQSLITMLQSKCSQMAQLADREVRKRTEAQGLAEQSIQ